jgi:hypothetical protein
LNTIDFERWEMEEDKQKKPFKKGGAGEMWVSPASYEKKFSLKQVLGLLLFMF